MDLPKHELEAVSAYLSLPSGDTHYEIAGPDSAPTVVLVSGATLPMAVWLPLTRQLNTRGIRTVRYDLPGRGHTPLSGSSGDFEAHLTQLDDLLSAIGECTPLHLIGLASGALVAAEYGARHPGQISSCTLIAPDGAETSFTLRERMLSHPFVGPLLFRLVGRKSLLARVPRYSEREEIRSLVTDLLLFSLTSPDFAQAVATTVRTFPLHNGETVYERLSAVDVPSCIVWGEEDLITPPHAAPLMQTLFGEASVHLFPTSGHLPFIDQPERAAELISEHILSAGSRRHCGDNGTDRHPDPENRGQASL